MKSKKCKQCKEDFIPTRPLQPVCSIKCAVLQAKKNEEKRRRKETVEKKKELLTITQLEQLARRVFQKWIRKRDYSLPCISCGITTTPQWDGGHYLKAELFSGLIFDERNCHKQCSKCNDFLSGNELEYRDGLIKRYGIGYVTELESIKNKNRNYKYSREQLIGIRKTYQLKLKEIK